MPNPTPTWQLCPVYGTYRNLDGTAKAGTIRFTLSERVVDNTSNVIFPAGGVLEAPLGSQDGAFSLPLPCSDDLDITPRGWTVKVEEKLSDGSGRVYYIQPTLAAAASADGGINLRKIVVPNDAPIATPALLKGVPGGVAGLDVDGDVVNALGAKVTGGSGSTPVVGLDVDGTPYFDLSGVPGGGTIALDIDGVPYFAGV